MIVSLYSGSKLSYLIIPFYLRSTEKILLSLQIKNSYSRNIIFSMAQIINAQLEDVRVHPKKVEDYIHFVGEKFINELQKKSNKLKGKRLLNINATSYGGGVAEILRVQVALMRDLGIDAHWQVLKAPQEFYTVTKTFHNVLQGKNTAINESDLELFFEVQKVASKSFVESFDYVMVHDPQPLCLVDYTNVPVKHWIWRCHIDTSTPNQQLLNVLCPYIAKYESVIFTMEDFIFKDIKCNSNNIALIPPSIDPVSPKNVDMSETEVNNLLKSYNVDPDRPLIVQVSRFDPWKDPLGVIDVYRNIQYGQVAKGIKGLQLALVGSIAHDDPEGWLIYDRVMRKAGEDFDIHVYSNFHNVGDVAINSFQQGADVIMQKSLKEGFGLTVTEAMWNRKPVVGGNVGGIRLQIEDGKTGFLINNIQEATEKVLFLLQNNDVAKEMGRRGREKILKNFLCVHELEKIINLLLKMEK